VTESIYALAGVSLVALAIATPVQAQDAPPGETQAAPAADTGVEDIVVTAQKREQRLQDVPVSVTALTSNALQSNRIVNVMDLSGAVPNLTARQSSGGGHQSTFTLRGAFASASSPGSETSVATYIDGVYLGASGGAVFELPNIERIEVARGPQGTLFGQNSTAGAVSIYTPDPTGKLGVLQRVTVGNYAQFESKTVVNLPAVGPFSASIAYDHSQRHGDMKNLGAGTVWDFGPKLGHLKSPKYLGSFNRESLQAAVKFDPGGGLSATYKFFWFDEDSTPEGNGLLDVAPLAFGASGQAVADLLAADPGAVHIGQFKRPKAVNNWFSMPQKFSNQIHILTARYKVSDNLSIKDTFGYLRNHFHNINDISQALREAGGLNVFIRWAPFLAGAPYWSSLFDMLSEEARQVVVDGFTEGAHYHALWDGLDVEDGEPIVDKARFSAFIPGTCNLHELLQARGIDTLIVTGCLTNGCCESTARTGMEMGYRVLFVADGTAAVTDQEHNATLTMFAGSNVAEVVMADSVVSRIEAAAETPATA
jgi:iron complex outermembrane receptor protein